MKLFQEMRKNRKLKGKQSAQLNGLVRLENVTAPRLLH
jgi:hypothetical protein